MVIQSQRRDAATTGNQFPLMRVKLSLLSRNRAHTNSTTTAMPYSPQRRRSRERLAQTRTDNEAVGLDDSLGIRLGYRFRSIVRTGAAPDRFCLWTPHDMATA